MSSHSSTLAANDVLSGDLHFVEVQKEKARFAPAAKLIADEINGEAQRTFAEDPSQLNAVLDNVTVNFLNLKNSANMQRFLRQIASLEKEEFEILTERMAYTALQLAQELMDRNKNNDEATKYNEDRHYREVTDLAFKAMCCADREERLNLLLLAFAAPFHDGHKYAQKARILEDGSIVLEDHKDNDYALYHHEAISALGIEAIAKAGRDIRFSVPKKGSSRDKHQITIPREFFSMAAAVAAPHGLGEFPEKIQRLFGKFKNNHLYLSPADNLIQPKHANTAAVALHLADLINGLFGEDGFSFIKYYGKSGTAQVKNLEYYFTEAGYNPMGTVQYYLIEILDCIQRLEGVGTVDQGVLGEFKREVWKHVAKAQAFKEWALQLPANDDDRSILDVDDSASEALEPSDEKKAAYARLISRAKQQDVFDNQDNLDKAETNFRREYGAYLEKELEALCDNQNVEIDEVSTQQQRQALKVIAQDGAHKTLRDPAIELDRWHREQQVITRIKNLLEKPELYSAA